MEAKNPFLEIKKPAPQAAFFGRFVVAFYALGEQSPANRREGREKNPDFARPLQSRDWLERKGSNRAVPFSNQSLGIRGIYSGNCQIINRYRALIALRCLGMANCGVQL